VLEDVKAVLLALDESSFRKSVKLDLRPEMVADIYLVDCMEETWYVKLFVDKEPEVHIEVWSCVPDGWIH